MCASQQDTGEEQPPESPQPHALSPPSSRPPRRSYILLPFRPPRRPRQDDAPLSGTEPPTASEPPSASESRTAGGPPIASDPVTSGGTTTASKPPTAGEPPTLSDPPASGGTPTASESPPAGEPPAATEPPTASDSRQRNDPARQVAQASTSGNASAGIYATRLVDASMIVIGVAVFLCALATLSTTWAWSWHAGSAGTFTLSRMHGVCTSAMGELAQGASGNVASHCLWVDGTWTGAVALTGGGCILAAIGVGRIVHSMRTPD